MWGIGDGDLLVHEIAILGQYIDEEENLQVLPFHYLEDLLVTRIEEIKKAAKCEDIQWYLTGKGNFRYNIATVKPYKENRKAKPKPIHFENVKWFLISRYKAITVEGMEADDILAVKQTEDTVICTRDKDLLMVPGWHYGWEVGNQPEQPLHFVTELGELNATYKDSISAKTGKELHTFKKLTGTGYLWFCAQTLTGDATDNIPGCKGVGPKKAYECLSECKSKEDALQSVLSVYREVYEENPESRMLEQARLVWMVRELNEDGSPVMWEMNDVI